MSIRRSLIALLVALALGAGAVALAAGGGEDGLDHVIAAADLDDCATTEEPARIDPARSWHRASATGTVHCEAFGGHLAWARFPDARALRRDLAGRRPRAPYCVYGTEVVVHHLTVEPAPEVLCEQLKGRLFNSRAT